MPFLTQNRYPGLWKIFQYVIGGTVDKRRLCLKYYQGEKNILEVGCSIGNISSAFTGLPGIRFTGIDIDPVVIAFAQKEFRSHPEFRFVCDDLRTLARGKGERYDYILFAGICHHVDDHDCRELLETAAGMLSKSGKLVVVDPLLPEAGDPWFVHAFLKLEQGRYLRTGERMRALLQQLVMSSANGLRIEDSAERLIGASPFHLPICARFGTYLLGFGDD